MRLIKEYQVLIGAAVLSIVIGGAVLTAVDRIVRGLDHLSTSVANASRRSQDVRVTGHVRTTP